MSTKQKKVAASADDVWRLVGQYPVLVKPHLDAVGDKTGEFQVDLFSSWQTSSVQGVHMASQSCQRGITLATLLVQAIRWKKTGNFSLFKTPDPSTPDELLTVNQRNRRDGKTAKAAAAAAAADDDDDDYDEDDDEDDGDDDEAATEASVLTDAEAFMSSVGNKIAAEEASANSLKAAAAAGVPVLVVDVNTNSLATAVELAQVAAVHGDMTRGEFMRQHDAVRRAEAAGEKSGSQQGSTTTISKAQVNQAQGGVAAAAAAQTLPHLLVPRHVASERDFSTDPANVSSSLSHQDRTRSIVLRNPKKN